MVLEGEFNSPTQFGELSERRSSYPRSSKALHLYYGRQNASLAGIQGPEARRRMSMASALQDQP